MAFFGLTALGPQNSFAESAKSTRNLHIFDAEDFKSAWNKVNGFDATYGRVAKLDDVVREIFKGPVPPNDQYHIRRAFDESAPLFETPGSISQKMYLHIMMRLRQEADEEAQINSLNPQPASACEFSSSQQFKESMMRHKRLRNNVQTKQLTPLTASQEYGWEAQELKPPVAGRGGSDITKFAAELVKND